MEKLQTLKRISIGICLLPPLWNAVVNVGWEMVLLLVGWVGKCSSEH